MESTTDRPGAYIAIDLKSFYASVECVEAGYDALDVNLVVADESRTEKTICLAVSPALKSCGIGGRARLFEVIEKVKEVNAQRRMRAPGHAFTGKSCSKRELDANPSLELDFVIARPRMAYYMEYSRRIVGIYTRFISFEDIHVYSVDEVFMDVGAYLDLYKLSARELAMKLIREVLRETGITATAGIGTNLYLCKVAMDIVAKKMPADSDGVRIADLDEMSYRRCLWEHTPLTDFWRVGKGYVRRLEKNGLHTMGDIARCSLGKAGDHYNEELLYKLFGVNAELLIDHAWGYESCTIRDIKEYRAETSSLSSGQVLSSPYPNDKALIVLKEMARELALEVGAKRMNTCLITLSIGYDAENLSDPVRMASSSVEKDFYGKPVPKPANGSKRLKKYTSSTEQIINAAVKLFEEISDKALTVRRMYLAAGELKSGEELDRDLAEQLSFLTEEGKPSEGLPQPDAQDERDKRRQQAILDIRRRFGKNAVMLGTSLEEGATQKERNAQIGGHRA